MQAFTKNVFCTYTNYKSFRQVGHRAAHTYTASQCFSCVRVVCVCDRADLNFYKFTDTFKKKLQKKKYKSRQSAKIQETQKKIPKHRQSRQTHTRTHTARQTSIHQNLTTDKFSYTLTERNNPLTHTCMHAPLWHLHY